MSFPGKVEGSVELNHNLLCVYMLSKGCNSGMTEYINLEFSGNGKGDDQLTKTTTTTVKPKGIKK
jgi:hypothetical protein